VVALRAAPALQVAAVGEREVARCVEFGLGAVSPSEHPCATGRACRHSSRGAPEGGTSVLTTNPVTGVRVPRQSTVPTDMSPFTEEELEAAYDGWRQQNARLAEILLVLG
jgi:hypothetical protein